MNDREISMDVDMEFARLTPGVRRRPMALIRLFASLDTDCLLAAVNTLFEVYQQIHPEHDWDSAIALVIYCGMAMRPAKETVTLRDGREVIICDLFRGASKAQTLNDYRDFISSARDGLLRGQTVAEATKAAWHGPLCGVTKQLYTIEAAQAEVAELSEALRDEGYLTKSQKTEGGN